MTSTHALRLAHTILWCALALNTDIANAQSARAVFSGTWKQDTSRTASVGGGRGNRETPGGGRGGGLGLGQPADELVITQTAAMLSVEERRGTTTTRITYALDGARKSNTVGAGRNAGALAVYVSTWKDARLETRITMPAAPQSRDTVEYVETRFIDRDGSLVIETTLSGNANLRRLVYLRATR